MAEDDDGPRRVSSDPGSAVSSSRISMSVAPAAIVPTTAHSRRRKPPVDETVKTTIFIGVVLAIVFCSREVGEIILRFRSFFRKNVELWPCLMLIGGVQGARTCFPPLYYLAPFGTLALLILIDKLGYVNGAFVYQALKILDVAWFLVIRRSYSGLLASILDRSTPPPCWLPLTIVSALRMLDEEWAHRIRPPVEKQHPASFLLWRASYIVLLGTAWATDIELTLVFVSTRCGLPLPFFAFSWVATLLVTLPETVVRALIVKAMAEALATTSTTVLKRGFDDIPVWLLVLWIFLAVGATLIVHLIHTKLICKALSEEDSFDLTIHPQGAHRDDLGDIEMEANRRQDRRERVLAQQRRQLDDNAPPSQF